MAEQLYHGALAAGQFVAEHPMPAAYAYAAVVGSLAVPYYLPNVTTIRPRFDPWPVNFTDIDRVYRDINRNTWTDENDLVETILRRLGTSTSKRLPTNVTDCEQLGEQIDFYLTEEQGYTPGVVHPMNCTARYEGYQGSKPWTAPEISVLPAWLHRWLEGPRIRDPQPETKEKPRSGVFQKKKPSITVTTTVTVTQREWYSGKTGHPTRTLKPQQIIKTPCHLPECQTWTTTHWAWTTESIFPSALTPTGPKTSRATNSLTSSDADAAAAITGRGSGRVTDKLHPEARDEKTAAGADTVERRDTKGTRPGTGHTERRFWDYFRSKKSTTKPGDATAGSEETSDQGPASSGGGDAGSAADHVTDEFTTRKPATREPRSREPSTGEPATNLPEQSPSKFLMMPDTSKSILGWGLPSAIGPTALRFANTVQNGNWALLRNDIAWLVFQGFTVFPGLTHDTRASWCRNAMATIFKPGLFTSACNRVDKNLRRAAFVHAVRGCPTPLWFRFFFSCVSAPLWIPAAILGFVLPPVVEILSGWLRCIHGDEWPSSATETVAWVTTEWLPWRLHGLFQFPQLGDELARFLLVIATTVIAHGYPVIQNQVSTHSDLAWYTLLAFIAWSFKVLYTNMGGFCFLDIVPLGIGYLASWYLYRFTRPKFNTLVRLPRMISNNIRSHIRKRGGFVFLDALLLLALYYYFAPAEHCPHSNLRLPLFLVLSFLAGYHVERTMAMLNRARKEGKFHALVRSNETRFAAGRRIVVPVISLFLASAQWTYCYWCLDWKVMIVAAISGARIGYSLPAPPLSEVSIPEHIVFRRVEFANEILYELRRIQHNSVGHRVISWDTWLYLVGVPTVCFVWANTDACIFGSEVSAQCPVVNVDRWPGVFILASAPTVLFIARFYCREHPEENMRKLEGPLQSLFWWILFASIIVCTIWFWFWGTCPHDIFLIIMTIMLWSLVGWRPGKSGLFKPPEIESTDLQSKHREETSLGRVIDQGQPIATFHGAVPLEDAGQGFLYSHPIPVDGQPITINVGQHPRIQNAQDIPEGLFNEDTPMITVEATPGQRVAVPGHPNIMIKHDCASGGGTGGGGGDGSEEPRDGQGPGTGRSPSDSGSDSRVTSVGPPAQSSPPPERGRREEERLHGRLQGRQQELFEHERHEEERENEQRQTKQRKQEHRKQERREEDRDEEEQPKTQPMPGQAADQLRTPERSPRQSPRQSPGESPPIDKENDRDGNDGQVGSNLLGGKTNRMPFGIRKTWMDPILQDLPLDGLDSQPQRPTKKGFSPPSLSIDSTLPEDTPQNSPGSTFPRSVLTSDDEEEFEEEEESDYGGETDEGEEHLPSVLEKGQRLMVPKTNTIAPQDRLLRYQHFEVGGGCNVEKSEASVKALDGETTVAEPGQTAPESRSWSGTQGTTPGTDEHPKMRPPSHTLGRYVSVKSGVNTIQGPASPGNYQQTTTAEDETPETAPSKGPTASSVTETGDDREDTATPEKPTPRSNTARNEEPKTIVRKKEEDSLNGESRFENSGEDSFENEASAEDPNVINVMQFTGLSHTEAAQILGLVNGDAGEAIDLFHTGSQRKNPRDDRLEDNGTQNTYACACGETVNFKDATTHVDSERHRTAFQDQVRALQDFERSQEHIQNEGKFSTSDGNTKIPEEPRKNDGSQKDHEPRNDIKSELSDQDFSKIVEATSCTSRRIIAKIWRLVGEDVNRAIEVFYDRATRPLPHEWCPVCDSNIDLRDLDSHRESKQHNENAMEQTIEKIARRGESDEYMNRLRARPRLLGWINRTPTPAASDRDLWRYCAICDRIVPKVGHGAEHSRNDSEHKQAIDMEFGKPGEFEDYTQCGICGIRFSEKSHSTNFLSLVPADWVTHRKLRYHLHVIVQKDEATGKAYCAVCEEWLSLAHLEEHMESKDHRRREEQMHTDKQRPRTVFCEWCQRLVTRDAFEDHRRSKEHRQNKRVRRNGGGYGGGGGDEDGVGGRRSGYYSGSGGGPTGYDGDENVEDDDQNTPDEPKGGRVKTDGNREAKVPELKVALSRIIDPAPPRPLTAEPHNPPLTLRPAEETPNNPLRDETFKQKANEGVLTSGRNLPEARTDTSSLSKEDMAADQLDGPVGPEEQSANPESHQKVVNPVTIESTGSGPKEIDRTLTRAWKQNKRNKEHKAKKKAEKEAAGKEAAEKEAAEKEAAEKEAAEKDNQLTAETTKILKRNPAGGKRLDKRTRDKLRKEREDAEALLEKKHEQPVPSNTEAVYRTLGATAEVGGKSGRKSPGNHRGGQSGKRAKDLYRDEHGLPPYKAEHPKDTSRDLQDDKLEQVSEDKVKEMPPEGPNSTTESSQSAVGTQGGKHNQATISNFNGGNGDDDRDLHGEDHLGERSKDKPEKRKKVRGLKLRRYNFKTTEEFEAAKEKKKQDRRDREAKVGLGAAGVAPANTSITATKNERPSYPP